MARYTYTAQNKYKQIVQGDIDASTREEAMVMLRGQGLVPIKLALVRTPTFGERVGLLNLPLGKRLTLLDQITITRHLGTILETGTDLMAGLEIIARDAIKPTVKRTLYDIRAKISRGQRFSEALATWKDEFDPIFISLVRAGETSGNLPKILLSYSQQLRKDYAFTRKLKGALVYPAILVVALFGMVMLILTVVVPRLKEVFSTTDIEPPLYTRIFFSISDFWLINLIPILITLGALVTLVLFMLQYNKARRWLASILWYLPLLNKIQKNLILSRFTKTLATLIDAGFPLQQALLITGEVAGKRYERVLSAIAKEKLEQGIFFSQALAEHRKYFPAIMVSVIATGEKSGQLSQVLRQLSEFYEEEVSYSLELFLTLIEPFLLVIVGVIVALIASSLISPLYRLIGKIR